MLTVTFYPLSIPLNPLLHTPHFLVFPHSPSPSSFPFIITLFLLKCYSPLSHYTTHSFLNNHTQFQTKMSKIYTGRFQTETSQKPYPLGPHIPAFYIAYIKEYPPPPLGISVTLDHVPPRHPQNPFICSALTNL